MGHLQVVSQWLTDAKEVVECFDEAKERKKQVIKWENWGVSEGIELLGYICSHRKAVALLHPLVSQRKKTRALL